MLASLLTLKQQQQPNNTNRIQTWGNKTVDQNQSDLSLVAQMGNNLPTNKGVPGLIPASGRSPGEGNGYLLQYSCLEDTMDRGAWKARVYRVVESDMTEQLSTYTHIHFNRSW